MGEGWWGGAESPGGILARAISMTHSGILYRLDISTFYVFLRPLKIYKNVGLPLSTITYIQYEISYFIKIQVKVFYIQI